MTTNCVFGNICLWFDHLCLFNCILFSPSIQKEIMQFLFPFFLKNQDLLAKAQFVILHGHRLAASHHYALDLICQRCNELRYLSDILVNEIKTKRIQLSRTFKMHKILQQVVSWDMVHFWKRRYFFFPRVLLRGYGAKVWYSFGIKFVGSLKDWVWLCLFTPSTLQYSEQVQYCTNFGLCSEYWRGGGSGFLSILGPSL